MTTEGDHSNSRRCFPSGTKAGRRPRKRWRTGTSERTCLPQPGGHHGDNGQPGPGPVTPLRPGEKRDARPGEGKGVPSCRPFLQRGSSWRRKFFPVVGPHKPPAAPKRTQWCPITELRKRKLNEGKPCAPPPPRGFSSDTWTRAYLMHSPASFLRAPHCPIQHVMIFCHLSPGQDRYPNPFWTAEETESHKVWDECPGEAATRAFSFLGPAFP